MRLDNDVYYPTGDLSCHTCLWCDQCADDEICEHYDCINSDIYTCSSFESYEDYKITWLEYVSQHSDNSSWDELLN